MQRLQALAYTASSTPLCPDALIHAAHTPPRSLPLPPSHGPLQALEALRKLRTEKAHEVKELKLKLEHTRTLRDQAQVGCWLGCCAGLLCWVGLPVSSLVQGGMGDGVPFAPCRRRSD